MKEEGGEREGGGREGTKPFFGDGYKPTSVLVALPLLQQRVLPNCGVQLLWGGAGSASLMSMLSECCTLKGVLCKEVVPPQTVLVSF